MSVSAYLTDLLPSPSASLCVLCVSLSVTARKVYCRKMAEWFQMPFEMVSGVSRGIRVITGVVIVEGGGAVLGVNLGRLIVTNGDFVA